MRGGEYWLRTDPQQPSRTEAIQEARAAAEYLARCCTCGEHVLISDGVIKRPCKCERVESGEPVRAI